ncbi:hypothetical protein COP2_036442 [Malus domestica]
MASEDVKPSESTVSKIVNLAEKARDGGRFHYPPRKLPFTTIVLPLCFLRALQRRRNPIPATAGPVSFLTNLAFIAFGLDAQANFGCYSSDLRAASTTTIDTQPWMYLLPTPQASFAYYLGSSHAILVKFLTTILSPRKREGS